MNMEDDGEGSPGTPGTPFWVQSSSRSRLRFSSIFLNSGVFFIFLCLFMVFCILLIVPRFLSLSSNILRPNLVKKSWDWLNAVLIVLALVFGFLSRNHDRKFDDEEDRTVLIGRRSEFQWDEFSGREASNGLIRSSFGSKRNSSSYPDLRDTTSFDHRRFLDDTHVGDSRSADSDQVRRGGTKIQDEEMDRDQIYIDKEMTVKKEVYKSPVPATVTAPAPAPARLIVRPPISPDSDYAEEKIDLERKQVMGHSENMKRPSSSSQGTIPAEELPEKKKKSSKHERRRSGGGSVTKEFLNSFYHQSKRKKNQRAKSLDNLEFLLEPNDLHLPLPPSPPPPPPPPPRTSVFQNILSAKKRKPKKTISVPAPPPPPPPPRKERKPIPPVKQTTKTHEDSTTMIGNESPLIPIPPPPPPFKLPSWKFVVQGDYVRVGSFNSSISESSDADEKETDSNGTHTAAGALFCPSPDVNTKAEMFIASFRAGLQLQKIHSLEQKQKLGMSKLGPQSP